MTKRRCSTKKAANKRRAFGTSPFSRVQNEVGQTHDLRAGLIKKAERHFGARIFTYFASFSHFDAQLIDADAEMLENLLSIEHDGGRLMLVINSPGGQALAAERMVNVCRAYSQNQFEVIVPHMAKSAATMVCFGASKIHMSRTAELGPVDPQVAYKDDAGQYHWISADEYVRSYENLISAATSVSGRIDAYIQQLARYDAREIERLRSQQDLSADISVKLLQNMMMNGKTADEIRQKIAPFLKQKEKGEHGRMIGLDEAKACGIEIQEIALGAEPWRWIWELYVRSSWVVETGIVAVIESATAAVSRAKP